MELYFYKAQVKKVLDGDTVDVLIDVGFNMHYSGRIRLYGINAPESRTSNLEEKVAGLAAKEFVENWIEENNHTVFIKTVKDKNEKYGRLLAEVYNQDKTKCLNVDIVNSGLARSYYGIGDKTWEEFKANQK
jgi:micrococcal nuclease